MKYVNKCRLMGVNWLKENRKHELNHSDRH